MTASVEWASIGALVQANADRFGDAEALVEGELRWSFRRLAEEVEASARAFIAAGVEVGDRVAIWAPNISEWIVSALGAVSAGAALVPLNSRFKGNEAADVIGRSGARIVLCVNGFLGNDYVEMLGQCSDGVPVTVERIVVLRGDAPAGTSTWADFLVAGLDVSPTAAAERLAEIGPDDVSDILFTSGTTGRPKGVITSHYQNLRVFDAWRGIVGLREGDRYLIVNPFFHSFGYKAGILACLLAGAAIIPYPVFDVTAVLELASREQVTMLPGPPTIYQTILDHPSRDAFDLSSLRLAVTGAAVVPVRMIERMREELTFRTIVTGYGLTETTGTVTMCRHDDDPETIALTSGRAIPDVEVRVIDAEGNEVPRETPGEIVCRGYNVMRGYYNDPGATAVTIDADGWLHTGDIGVMDDRGYLRITDRLKDMIIVGGFNVYPAEVENAMLRHPAIGQVAVVGMPDERMGEVPVAFVIPRPGTTPTAEELIAWSRVEMANYKVPRRIDFVDVLPTNASGKVLKTDLRARLLG